MNLEPTLCAERSDHEGTHQFVFVFELEAVCETLNARPSEVREWDRADLAEELGFDSRGFSNGPGRRFSHGARARVAGRRVIVRGSSALDI